MRKASAVNTTDASQRQIEIALGLRSKCAVAGAAWASGLLSERDLEHRDDDFVPVDVVDERQAVMVPAVRSQHKPFGHVSVLSSPDPHKFVRCAIEGADGAESGGPQI